MPSAKVKKVKKGEKKKKKTNVKQKQKQKQKQNQKVVVNVNLSDTKEEKTEKQTYGNPNVPIIQSLPVYYQPPVISMLNQLNRPAENINDYIRHQQEPSIKQESLGQKVGGSYINPYEGSVYSRSGYMDSDYIDSISEYGDSLASTRTFNKDEFSIETKTDPSAVISIPSPPKPLPKIIPLDDESTIYSTPVSFYNYEEEEQKRNILTKAENKTPSLLSELSSLSGFRKIDQTDDNSSIDTIKKIYIDIADLESVNSFESNQKQNMYNQDFINEISQTKVDYFNNQILTDEITNDMTQTYPDEKHYNVIEEEEENQLVPYQKKHRAGNQRCNCGGWFDPTNYNKKMKHFQTKQHKKFINKIYSSKEDY